MKFEALLWMIPQHKYDGYPSCPIEARPDLIAERIGRMQQELEDLKELLYQIVAGAQ